ncbi:MAG: hypothetical protein J6B10_06020 [Lachnospiraceae bacterium]|nr:hypothetical protein [Lachnospiraceae bacterium]
MLKREISERQLNIVGMLLIFCSFLPYVLLKEGSVILVGDQLDGEIFTYLYGAKYLFSGQQIIAEYMGGIQREALFPPALLSILFYKLLPPLAAFLVNQLVVTVTAFWGMRALLSKLFCNQWIAFLTAVLFAFLPFYSVYGLSVAGIPMLLWALIRLKEEAESERQRERTDLFPIVLVCLYAAFSSFVLIGYAVVGCLCLYCVVLLLSKRRKAYVRTYLTVLMMLVFYLAVNHALVSQVLGIGETQISHKSEYILHAQPFLSGAWNLFVHGSGHAPSYHAWMILPVCVTIVAGAVFRHWLSEEERKQYKLLICCFLMTVCIALFYGVFQAAGLVELRQRLGGFFVYFQFDRIYWFYPVLWYVMLGMMLMLSSGLVRHVTAKKTGGKTAGTVHQKAYASLSCILPAGLLLAAAVTVLWQSDLKKNVRQLLGPDTSHAVTWEKYYGTEIFEEIKDFLPKEQNRYRVASVGLNPAVAAYNGFYTVDGYSNNYELSYKHAFREVIAGELEKDEALRRYFDDWGNRCYLFSAELGQEYYFEKDSGVSIQELCVDTEKLKELGCEYVFAGVPIENAEELGWTLEGTFEARESDCRYCIRVYRI